MKTIVKLFLLILGFALAESAVAQPPPNDYFENRIPLVGSSLTWTGNTFNATEDYDDPLLVNQYSFFVTENLVWEYPKSVW